MGQDLQKAISKFLVRVDEFDFPVIPKTLVFKSGKNERTVEKMDNDQLISSEDNTTGVGMIKFDVKLTAESLRNAEIVESRSQVTVKIFTEDGTVDKVMRSGVSINNTERSVSDSKLTLEFQGTELE